MSNKDISFPEETLLKADTITHRNTEHNLQQDEEKSPIIQDLINRNEKTFKKLWVVSCICLVFMAIEVIGGYLANSIAIMSDAAHLFSDFLGFLISLLSIYISQRGATSAMSYGYHRAEVIGAMVSVNLIWGLTLWLLYEATLRVLERPPVDGLIMLVVAVIGFVFNVVMGMILSYQGIDHNLHHHHHGTEDSLGNNPEGYVSVENSKTAKYFISRRKASLEERRKDSLIPMKGAEELLPERKKSICSEPGEMDKYGSICNISSSNEPENVNLRAAFIHVIGDAIQNLGVVIAGLIVYFWPKLSIADPICTYIFSIIVVFTTIRILRDCISVLMEGSPLEFDLSSLERDLSLLKGVVEVHDLHVWSLSIGKISLSCHVSSTSPQITLKKARKLIKHRYKITHSTIQVELDSERGKNDCIHDLHK